MFNKFGSNHKDHKISLAYLFCFFLKIGSTAWGGFMPFIAVIQNHVTKHKLLEEGEFTDTLFLASILPGPMAFNVSIGVGYRIQGIRGALVCGLGAIIPAFIFVLALSIIYFHCGQIAVVEKFCLGIAPATIAIILLTAWKMARKTIKGLPEFLFSMGGCLIVLGTTRFYSNIVVVLGSGFLGWLLFGELPKLLKAVCGASRSRDAVDQLAPRQHKIGNSTRLMSISPLLAVGLIQFWISPLKLFATFSAISLTLFGSGYVFIPVVQKLIVSKGWLTDNEFVAGLAISQMTPGPLMIVSTFIGYKVAGFFGALSATIGMFLPPALLMVAATYFLCQLNKSAVSTVIESGMRGIRPSIVGMIVAGAFGISNTVPQHWVSALIFVTAIIAIRFDFDIALIVPLAGFIGLTLY